MAPDAVGTGVKAPRKHLQKVSLSWFHAAYKTKLRNLAAKARTIIEETGANNLYLTFGMLNWRFDDRELRSPLVLVPVTIVTANRGERYGLTLDEAGMSTRNYCLAEKLRVSFGLEIPELTSRPRMAQASTWAPPSTPFAMR
ncbi:hypothetical protein A4G29_03440 [Mycobacterium kansasii]|nr:hypothetical protein A4G29_03440 [Mycobacterium kansasii]